jgi:undecaprenyl-diphosphatase
LSGTARTLFDYLVASDDRLFGRLLEWRPPRWVRVWMLWASRLGDGWVWLVAAAALAASGTRGPRVLLAGLVSAGLANAFLIVTKWRVRRARPCDRAMPAHFDVSGLAWLPSDRFSFPSGHALNSFALGTLVALAFPALALPVLAAAASVAASRVVLGLHWLSDVLAGVLVGSLIGSCVWLVLLR